MPRSIVFALCLSACTSLETGSIEQPIIGGQIADTSKFPAVVALENSPGNWFCTGTLIDKDWVLTAAHCVEGQTAAGVSVRLGDNNINDTTGGRVVAVTAIHGHPGFDGIAWDNDIAVVKLAQSVTDRAPTPIHRMTVPVATSVIDVGYGDSDNNGGGAGILREVTVTTADCAQAGDPSVSSANVLCFDARLGKTSCYGDSGGPAYLAVNGGLVVAGVTSGGTGNTCTGGWDLYTSVAAELAFVDQYVPQPDPADPGTGDGTGDGSGDGSGSGSGDGSGSGSGDDSGASPDDGIDDSELMGGCAVTGRAGLGSFALLVIAAIAAIRRRRTR